MYQTATVARLAGAISLVVILATWGLLALAVAGETTATTWALALASMFPISALVLGVVEARFPRTAEYAVGLVVGVVALSTAYLGVVAADDSLIEPVAAFGPVELLAAALGCGVLVGLLALVDQRYVEHPPSAALLEERHLDEPISDD